MEVYFHYEVSDVVLRAEQVEGITARRERSAHFRIGKLSPPAKQALFALLDAKEFREIEWAANGHEVKQAHVRLVAYRYDDGRTRERMIRFETSWPTRREIEAVLMGMAQERERTLARARRQAIKASARVRRVACPVFTFPSLRLAGV